MLLAMTSTPVPAPRTRCPLCGGPNACAPAASGTFETPCWCADARFAPALLAALPRGGEAACVCAACVRGMTPASTAAGD